jgi:hypothetical protein
VIARGALALALVLALACTAVYARFRLPAPPPPLPEATRTALLAFARATLGGTRPPPLAGAGLDAPARLPLYVSVYAGGELAFRGEGTGATVVEALGHAARPLSPLPAVVLERARIKIDRTTGEGPVSNAAPLVFALSVVPGADGLRCDAAGRRVTLLPDDLLLEELLTGYAPFRFMEFELGLATDRAVALVATRLGMSREAWQAATPRWSRLRTEAFVESPAHDRALAVDRGNTPGPALDRASLRQGAIAGGRYLVSHLHPDGSFDYQVDALSGQVRGADYALPRHFGAAMYLAELYRFTGDPAFGAAARQAFAYVEPHEREVREEIGSAALAVLALTEYRRAEPPGMREHYDPVLGRLGAFVLRLQRPAGDFVHLPNEPEAKLLYFDGEAAFALARLAREFGDARYRDAARRALDWLTGDAYRHFAGGFYFGEDHWTCMAAEELAPLAPTSSYERFCRAYAAFLRRAQFQPGQGPAAFTGAYGFTPFFPPHTTPAASRTQAMISAYELGRRLGRPDPAIHAQVLESLRYLLAQQIRPDNAYLMAAPENVLGGWNQSPLRRFVRIDFVQHAGDALLRGQALLP